MCDTFVALGSATADGSVIFGKNSDRPSDERQPVVHVPAHRHEPGAALSCTYISIPQVETTLAVILSQPDWMWGVEMGANEAGVVIGNEAVWTTEPLGPPALLGMDIVRLGLERGESAEAALHIMTALLETHGQGGACAQDDGTFSYHNSFLITDRDEAWVLETAGSLWVAEHITDGVRNISNGLTIRTNYDLVCESLQGQKVDFAETYGIDGVDSSPYSRQACGYNLLDAQAGEMTPEDMMNILRDHESGICMHGSFSSTASQVSKLSEMGDTHWFTGAPHPCRTPFKEIELP